MRHRHTCISVDYIAGELETTACRSARPGNWPELHRRADWSSHRKSCSGHKLPSPCRWSVQCCLHPLQSWGVSGSDEILNPKKHCSNESASVKSTPVQHCQFIFWLWCEDSQGAPPNMEGCRLVEFAISPSKCSSERVLQATVIEHTALFTKCIAS